MTAVIALLCCVLSASASGQVGQSHSGHAPHSSTVESRGDSRMGFSHNKSTHHFRLYSDGGAIQVTADDPKDAQDVAAIRAHLQHISKMFAAGDFSAPMFIHDRVPPGVPVLRKAKDAVSYRFEELPAGAQVRVTTSNEAALKAVHDFLRFQIADHHTGDGTAVTSSH